MKTLCNYESLLITYKEFFFIILLSSYTFGVFNDLNNALGCCLQLWLEITTHQQTVGILGNVGIDVDNERLDKVISELKDKNIGEVLTAGNQKLASVPAGSAVHAKGGGVVEAPATEEKKRK